MPTVEKVRGGRVLVRGIGRFEIDDRADVSAADAEYLVEERGDFEYVGGSDESEDVDEEEDGDEGEDAEEDGDGDADEADVADEADGEETGALPFNPESHTVDEIEARVADLDDSGEVRAIRNVEQEQKDRTTAVDAINDRLADLEG